MAPQEWDVRGAGKCDPEFGVAAVRIVRETGKPVAQVAWDVGIQEGPTLGHGVNVTG